MSKRGGGGAAKAHARHHPSTLTEIFWSNLPSYNRHTHMRVRAHTENTGCWGLVEEVKERSEQYYTLEQKAARLEIQAEVLNSPS